jgi:hypothetical protein
MLDPNTPPPRRAVNLRSLLLGVLGVLFICGLAPYNDYAMGNTYLVGNFLPLGLVIATLFIALLVNAPLRMIDPKLAFTQGELAVALSMTLVSCTIPTSGFMRYVPASMVGMYTHAAEPRFAQAMKDAGLRDWMMPQMETTEPSQRSGDPVVRNYFNKTPDIQPGLTGALNAVPWHAWIRPAIAWGAFAVALYGACWCISLLVHHQWARNERLSFPLAGVYCYLIEDPEPGKAVNRIFSSPGFWIAVAIVFVIHSFSVLNAYFPRNVPALSLTYDFNSLLNEEPLNRTSWYVKKATLYFSIVGICFFLQGAVSFSLWATIILLDIGLIVLRNSGGEFTDRMETDQNLGAMAVFALSMVWIGRSHWWMILRNMVGARRSTDPQGEFASYATAGWGLVVCIAGLMVWLMAAGMSFVTAGWVVLFMLGCYLILARVVAETGLTFVQLRGTVFRPLQYLQIFTQPTPSRVDNTSAFMTGWMNQILIHDARESATPYMTHAARVSDELIGPKDRFSRSGFIVAIALALVVGFFVSGASTLLVEYNFASTTAVKPESPLNEYGVAGSSKGPIEFFIEHTGAGPQENHNQMLHLAGGGLVTGVLAVLRLTFTWWPFHPVGFLLCYTFPMRMIWFSVFVGWLLKTLVMWLGGAQMIRTCRPIFLGLIVGEASVAGFWLIASLVLHSMGFDYYSVRLLPG